MNCQYPGCEKEAAIRSEFDNLRVDRRVVGFDNVPGKLLVACYCMEHFHQDLRDILAIDAKVRE